MCTDFVCQVKYTISWLNRDLRVYLDLYAPDFPKSTSKYLLFTKVVRKHVSRCFTQVCHLWIQSFLKQWFWTAQSSKFFKIYMLNVLLTKFSYFVVAKSVFFMIWWFLTKNASKIGCFRQKKVLWCKKYFKVLLGNPAHTNPNIPSNLYWAKRWCILLEGQSQCTWISFTCSTELKSSSPFTMQPQIIS